MHDYWIGDPVWIASLQKKGTFEGERDGMAIVKVQGLKHVLSFSDISLLPDDEDEIDLSDLTEEPKKSRKYAFDVPDTIDLHIEELNPQLTYAEPAQILAHQRSRLKDFLATAIEHHLRQVNIIHGVGEGVLRSEVLHLLKDFPEVRRIEHEAHGGAMTVYF